MLERSPKKNLCAADRRRWMNRLGTGPWCWPGEGDQPHFDRARAVLPAGPPALAPGVVPLLSVRGRKQASLWRLTSREHCAASGQVLGFDTTARAAWHNALDALPRSLPVIWASLRNLQQLDWVAEHVVTLTDDGTTEVRETSLDGPSFGLSFVLSLAARIFNRPVPEDVAASAEVAADGTLKGVDEIERKLRLVDACAPRIKRFFVCADQPNVDGMVVRSDLQVKKVKSAGEAVRLVFGENLAADLIALVGSAEQRSDLVDELFELALRGRKVLVDWNPVRRAAKLAYDQWGAQVDPDQRNRLRFAHATAARHEGAPIELELPDAAWVEAFRSRSLPLYIEVVSHLVQTATDKGVPTVEDAEELARAVLVDESTFTKEHYKLMGALGRLLATVGRTDDALVCQQRAANGFMQLYEFGELSYQLSEWYRLSGVLADEGQVDRAGKLFVEASDFEERLERKQSLARADRDYVDLARARAQVALGRDSDAARKTLEALWQGSPPDHVRFSAGRWLARWHDSRSQQVQADAIVRALADEAAAATDRSASARRFGNLALLDRALRAKDAPAAAKILDALKGDARVVRSIHVAAKLEVDAARHVARSYPY